MEIPSPVMTRRMGRPPMDLEETKVRLNAGDKERIVALRGPQGLGKFVREAVQEKLRSEEKRKPRKPTDP